MDTSTATISFKMGNERLIKVTENASRKLRSLLEKQGRPGGALRVAVIRRRLLRVAIQNGPGGWTGQSRHHGGKLERARGGRSEERAFCQRIACSITAMICRKVASR